MIQICNKTKKFQNVKKEIQLKKKHKSEREKKQISIYMLIKFGIVAVCLSVFHKTIISLRAERRRREARCEKFTHENLALPTIYLGPAGRPGHSDDDDDDENDDDNQRELLTSGADQQKLFTLSKHEIDEGEVK